MKTLDQIHSSELAANNYIFRGMYAYHRDDAFAGVKNDKELRRPAYKYANIRFPFYERIPDEEMLQVLKKDAKHHSQVDRMGWGIRSL